MNETTLLIRQLLAKIEILEAQIKAQAAEILELKRRLGQNSQNSSKPPSSDGLGRPARTKSLRVNGQKKSGGQPGHQGQTLERVEKPDNAVQHPLTNCPHCASDIKDEACVGIEKRQVI